MTYIYDGTFEGLLTAIFEIYKTRVPADSILDDQHQMPLLGEVKKIETREDLAARVLTGVDTRTDGRGAALVYKLFLSELQDIENIIFKFIQTIIGQNNPRILENYANPFILKAAQIDKMIHREVHRMHAFVRFTKTDQGKFYAAIEPDFNILPLLGDHFERRYADQEWIIFDTRRHYGLYYNLHETRFITAEDPIVHLGQGAAKCGPIAEKEQAYQDLWSRYFTSVNIKERKNIKLHLRHVPRRYWKYLVEKQKPGSNAN